ncbi:hypothetical protein [Bradyrhizobium prioriisuperbiae]|uniref:hypothetical protein n=1 Tax=Bradyrhizobium prioriisuperbiae TaxID=2854389 RepID=UPI0028E747A2|nr:hypothetical protein [Bradyrhizobium prioritasuperba]
MLRHARMKLQGLLSIALPALAGALLLSAPASADDIQIITQSQISRPQISRPMTAQPNAAVSGAGNTARYRPDAFLTLDLSKAVLSPIPLGPQARFEPFGIEARTDAADNLPNTTPHAARTASKIMAGARITPRPGATASSDVKPSDTKPSNTASLAPPTEATADESAAPSVKSKVHKSSAIRTRAVASRPHGNPLDAQAYARPKTQARAQPKLQTWPCRSGGICGWQN